MEKSIGLQQSYGELNRRTTEKFRDRTAPHPLHPNSWQVHATHFSTTLGNPNIAHVAYSDSEKYAYF